MEGDDDPDAVAWDEGATDENSEEYDRTTCITSDQTQTLIRTTRPVTRTAMKQTALGTWARTM